MRKVGHKLFLCSLLLCLNIAFIWGNSMLPGTVSAQISDAVLEIVAPILRSSAFEKVSSTIIELINGLLDLSIPSQNVGEHLLRKMAHFAEFCWLGLTLTWFFLILEQKGIHSFTMPLLCGVLTACIDETIQLYSVGRGSSLVDVWIDVAGVSVGIMILLLGHYLMKAMKH